MTFQHSSHTNPLPEVPIDLQVRRHVDRARQLQAETMAETIADVWFGLKHALGASTAWLARQRRAAATRRALSECSDRTLADIGIPREHIKLVARGIDHLDPEAVSRSGWWPHLVATVRRMQATRREQLRVYRELTAYSDRDLEEIGLRRADIPMIARAA